MEWIDVNDRLPEKGERVLIYGWEIGVCSCVAHLSTTGKWVESTTSNRLMYADMCTHWMPLPKPPEIKKPA
jgi:hypothetical protein